MTTIISHLAVLAVEENIPKAAVNFAMLNVENAVAYSQGVVQLNKKEEDEQSFKLFTSKCLRLIVDMA